MAKCYSTRETHWSGENYQEHESVLSPISVCGLLENKDQSRRGTLYVHHYLGPQSNCIFPKNSEPFIIFTFPNYILLEETSVEYVNHKVWKILYTACWLSLYTVHLHIYKLYAMIASNQHQPECIMAGFVRQKDRSVSCDDAVSCYCYEVSVTDE